MYWKDFVMRNPYKSDTGTSQEYLAGKNKLLDNANDIFS